ncbi:MAG: hypothetical protein EBV06_14370 [Planctomycetia bacterium]|nr:hypothetical protein [Planctomycetia bacterium]
MRTRFSFRPLVENLEERAVPATISVVSGSLYVKNQLGNLTITPQATAGQVRVQDSGNGQNIVFSGVSTGIYVTGTSLADNITVNATTNPFPGLVQISGGNSGDTINLQGSIGGNLTVLGELGNDTVNVTAALTVGGAVNIADTAGDNDLLLSGAFSVGGALSASGQNAVTLGANALTVGGNLTLSAVTSGVGLNLTSSGTFTVGKNLTITGYAADDTASLTGTIAVSGNTTVNLGAGSNTFALTEAATSKLGGYLSYTGTTGVDNIDIGNATGLTIAGTASFSLGDGANTFDVTATTTISSNLTVTGGSGGNTLNIGGTLNANASVTLGNGINSTTFTTSPGGLLTYRGGNTQDTLTLNATGATFNVDILFGTSGTHVLTMTNGTGASITGKAMSGTPATSTFNQNDATIVSPFTINF